MSYKFICPKCGGSFFGFVRERDGILTRCCKTHNCDFRWDTKSGDRDLKYFYKLVPAGAEE